MCVCVCIYNLCVYRYTRIIGSIGTRHEKKKYFVKAEAVISNCTDTSTVVPVADSQAQSHIPEDITIRTEILPNTTLFSNIDQANKFATTEVNTKDSATIHSRVLSSSTITPSNSLISDHDCGITVTQHNIPFVYSCTPLTQTVMPPKKRSESMTDMTDCTRKLFDVEIWSEPDDDHTNPPYTDVYHDTEAQLEPSCYKSKCIDGTGTSNLKEKLRFKFARLHQVLTSQIRIPDIILIYYILYIYVYVYVYIHHIVYIYIYIYIVLH